MVSIIVPVYNVAFYLERCVDSLLNQTLSDIEIILVDDGSNDESPAICDAYEKKDKRIKVIHKTNGGLSDARNVGICEAKGEYIIFVDSDDDLISDACEKLNAIMHYHNLETLYFGINRIDNDGTTKIDKNVPFDRIENGKILLAHELKSGKYLAMAQAGMFSRDFLISNNLYFKKGIFHEDEQWSPRVALLAQRAYVIGECYYNYYIRKGSITTTTNNMAIIKRATDCVDTAKELYERYDNEQGELKKYGLYYSSKLYMKGISMLSCVGEKVNVDRKYCRKCGNDIISWFKVIAFRLSPSLYAKLLSMRDEK